VFSRCNLSPRISDHTGHDPSLNPPFSAWYLFALPTIPAKLAPFPPQTPFSPRVQVLFDKQSALSPLIGRRQILFVSCLSFFPPNYITYRPLRSPCFPSPPPPQVLIPPWRPERRPSPERKLSPPPLSLWKRPFLLLFFLSVPPTNLLVIDGDRDISPQPVYNLLDVPPVPYFPFPFLLLLMEQFYTFTDSSRFPKFFDSVFYTSCFMSTFSNAPSDFPALSSPSSSEFRLGTRDFFPPHETFFLCSQP